MAFVKYTPASRLVTPADIARLRRLGSSFLVPGNGDQATDFRIFLNGTSTFFYLNKNTEQLQMRGIDINTNAPVVIDSDLTAQTLTIVPSADDTGTASFGNGTKDLDVKIFLGSNTEYVLFDRGAQKATFSAIPIDSNAAIATTANVTAAQVNATTALVTTVTASVVNSVTANFVTVGAGNMVAGNALLVNTTASNVNTVTANTVTHIITNLNSTTVNLNGVTSWLSTGYAKLKATAITANTTLNATHLGGLITNRGASGLVVFTLPNPASFTGAFFHYHGGAEQDVKFLKSANNTWITDNSNTINTQNVIFNTTKKTGAWLTAVSDGTYWYTKLSAGASVT